MSLSPAEIRAMRSTAIHGGARTFWALADAICAEYGITPKDIRAKGRGRLDVNEARQFLCLFAMRRGLSSTQVGKFLGRDHSTVLHAAGQAEIKEALATNPDQVLG